MNARSLHLGSVAGCMSIVDGKEHMIAGKAAHQRLEGEAEEAIGQGIGVPTGSPQRVVGRAEFAGDAGSAEPGRNGASAFGEQGADEQQKQTRGGAAVEGGRNVGEPSGQQIG